MKINIKKLLIRGVVCGAGAAALVIGLVGVCFISSRSATNLNLIHKEGSVYLEDEDRYNEIFPRMRLHSGDLIVTDPDSVAQLGIDKTKFLTIRENSRVEYKKNGKSVDVNLQEGNMFFQVTEPLTGKEKFQIRTASMEVNITGTSGYFSVDDYGEGTLELTDGQVEITMVDEESGAREEGVKVSAGERLTIYDVSDYEIEKIEASDLSKAALFSISQNDDLLAKVCSQTGWNQQEVVSLSQESGIWEVARSDAASWIIPDWYDDYEEDDYLLADAEDGEDYEDQWEDSESEIEDGFYDEQPDVIDFPPVDPDVSDPFEEDSSSSQESSSSSSSSNSSSGKSSSVSGSSGSSKSSSSGSSKSSSSSTAKAKADDMSPIIVSTSASGVMTLLDGSLFDPTYYASKYPDAAQLYGTDANGLLYHYCQMASKGEKRYGTKAEEDAALKASSGTTSRTSTATTTTTSRSTGSYTSGDYKYYLSGSTARIEDYDGSSSSVSIPSSISKDGYSYTVKTIGSSAFKSNSSLRSVTIPSSVTSIQSSAF
ncbi:MAG: FecR domain-containing protein, partial [Lachnospiraceae bacterium]|nr:FecR domain-containing protein [Lachnospiraceae bacterium]